MYAGDQHCFNNWSTANIVQINDSLTAHRYEFSALAKWHNKILLVPQNRRNVIDSIYMIDSSEIEQSLQQNTMAKHTSFALHNFKHTGAKNIRYTSIIFY